MLYKLQEGRHIGPSEVVDCPQACEHTPVGDTLEVVLTDVLEEENEYSDQSQENFLQ